MGKPRETTSTDEEMDIAETNVIICQKRHKKHKHKKHKRKKIMSHDIEQRNIGCTMLTTAGGSMTESDQKKSPKIRGGKKLDEVKGHRVVGSGTTKLSQYGSFGGFAAAGTSVIGTTPPRVLAKKKIPKGGRGKESATSSEEERWLDAIESGKLEEVDDELKKIKPKDPKLMTARQRAMFERKTDTEPNPGAERLVSLPSGYKEKVMTAEAIQKAALKSLKRKQLADEKREKDKKKTMERLLKKQESKASKFGIGGRGKAGKRQVPFVTYRMTLDASCISLPPGHEFPLGSAENLKAFETAATLGKEKRCSVMGCNNPRRYSCSKTGVPLCSLNCYRANLGAIST